MSVVFSQPQLRLRPMMLTDLKHVAAIEVMAYHFPWNIRIFNDCIRVGYRSWVLESDMTLVGYGLLSVAAGEAHVLNLCIHPKHQSHGYGRYLLNHLLNIARQNQVETVFLEVRRSNHIAVKLYQDIGFNQIGIRKRYYPAKGKQREDALVFALQLVLPSCE